MINGTCFKLFPVIISNFGAVLDINSLFIKIINLEELLQLGITSNADAFELSLVPFVKIY